MGESKVRGSRRFIHKYMLGGIRYWDDEEEACDAMFKLEMEELGKYPGIHVSSHRFGMHLFGGGEGELERYLIGLDFFGNLVLDKAGQFWDISETGTNVH